MNHSLKINSAIELRRQNNEVQLNETISKNYYLNEVRYHPSQNICAWKNDKGFVVQTNLSEVAKQIDAWAFSEKYCWGLNCSFWSFLIPRNKFPWVCKILGLPELQKSLGRVKYGKLRSLALNFRAEKPSQNENFGL